MFRKNYFTILLTAAVFLLGSFTAFAQTAQVRGTVQTTSADGKSTPVNGALIEVFRTDIKQKGPTAKTDKKGAFSFVALQLGGKYILSVSGAGLSPTVYPNVKAGDENIAVTLGAGDGKRLSEEEARQAESTPATQNNTTAAAPAQLTAEQKKQQEEYNKKVAEVTAKNANLKNADETLKKSFEEGNKAYEAKSFDAAIAKYNEAIAAVPDFVGSTPAVLNAKGAALTGRAVQTYNANVKAADISVKVQAMGNVKKDLADAADSYNQAWTIVKNASAADIAQSSNIPTYKTNALNGIRETFRLMALTEQVDTTKIDIGKALLPEYISVETDAAKKTEAQLYLGDVYRVVGDSDNAILEYKKVLETSPDNPDALAGVGFSLVNLGYINNDKTKMQEGANFLQKFSSVAPDTHKYKADAKGLIETLKAEQNVTPQKLPGKKKG